MADLFSYSGALIIGIFAFAAAVSGAALANIFSKDAETIIPKLAHLLICRAAETLPKRHAEEHREEWLSGLDEYEELSGKLIFAFSIRCSAVRQVKAEILQNQKKQYALTSGVFDLEDSELDAFIKAQLRALEYRNQQIEKWFRAANSHEIRRKGDSKSKEAERNTKRIGFLRSLR